MERLFRRRAVTSGQLAAWHALRDDFAVWKGLDGRNGASAKVDVSRAPMPLITDRQLSAGNRVRCTFNQLGLMSRKVLIALLDSHFSVAMSPWRELVRQVSREMRPEGQAAVVRLVLRELEIVLNQGAKR